MLFGHSIKLPKAHSFYEFFSYMSLQIPFIIWPILSWVMLSIAQSILIYTVAIVKWNWNWYLDYNLFCEWHNYSVLLKRKTHK